MSGTVSPALSGIPVPEDRWDPAHVPGSELERLVYRSNLLGADRALANEGGGNTSAKVHAADHTGQQRVVLWVKGSGTDLATITHVGFAALRLDEVLLLRRRDALDDAEMIAYLRSCCLSPDQPRPSIETLLHAFLPALHVDHTHPDAVIALASAPRGPQLVDEAFAGEVLWYGYRRPGFAMSREIADLIEARPDARAVFLDRHGLVTWGETSEASYGATIEFVSRAADVLASAGRGRFGLGGAAVPAADEARADELLASALPVLRGALRADGGAVVLEVDRSPEAVAFASSKEGPQVSQIGAPCPDHLIHTKHRPLALAYDPDSDNAAGLADTVRRGVAEYVDWYRAYYERNLTDESRPYPIDSPGPRVVLMPGIGIVTSGSDKSRARLARDLYRRAIRVEDAANAVGGFRSLSEGEAFEIEYWPLERFKLAQAPPPGELAGRVAIVTGGGSGIGRATARRLAELGAHVAVADLEFENAVDVAEQIRRASVDDRALAIPVDVTSERAVRDMVRRVVLEYGGVDILVASAGIASSAPATETTAEDWEKNHAVLGRGFFFCAREVFRVLIEQGSGGSIVSVGSKNALVAGANASAYSSAKAAALHLARCLAEEGGPHGIRVNTVNPDAVIEGSSIWSSEWKAERASTYGVTEDDLPAFYRARTVLGVTVFPEDVAEAIVFFASDRSGKSTGNIVNVDGGVTSAYPR